MPNSLVTAATVDRRIVRQRSGSQRRYYVNTASCGCRNTRLCSGSAVNTVVPRSTTPISYTCYWRERTINEGVIETGQCSRCSNANSVLRHTRIGVLCASCVAVDYAPCWGCERPIRNAHRRQTWCTNDPEAEAMLNSPGVMNLEPDQYDELCQRNQHYQLWLCRNCEYIDPNACELCQESDTGIGTITLDGREQRVCQPCLGRVVATCVGCGTYARTNDMVYGRAQRNSREDGAAPERIRYCRGCYGSWPSCGGCGSRVEPAEMEGGDCCLGCVQQTVCENIMPYHADALAYLGFQSAEVDALPRNRLFYGVEVELEYVGKRARRDALAAVESAKSDVRDIAILKHDGSLDCGIEIVSAPMTLARHHQAAWDARLSKIHQVFQPRQSCGLHVHVSRSELSENHIRLISEFIFNPANYEFVKFMARREENRYARIKDVNPHDSNNRNNRYLALNTGKDATIEFRMFASTTSGRAFYGSLEFVAALVAFAKERNAFHGLSLTQDDVYGLGLASRRRTTPLPVLEMRVPNFLEFAERLDTNQFGNFKSVLSAYTTGLGF